MANPLISADDVKAGRIVILKVIQSYRLLGLDKRATLSDIEIAYKNKLTDDADSVNQVRFEYAYKVAKAFRKIDDFAKSSIDDWERMFDAYSIFISEKNPKEQIEFENIDEEVQLSLFDIDVKLFPLKY